MCRSAFCSQCLAIAMWLLQRCVAGKGCCGIAQSHALHCCAGQHIAHCLQIRPAAAFVHVSRSRASSRGYTAHSQPRLNHRAHEQQHRPLVLSAEPLHVPGARQQDLGILAPARGSTRQVLIASSLAMRALTHQPDDGHHLACGRGWRAWTLSEMKHHSPAANTISVAERHAKHCQTYCL